jgi:predicted CXXCH cytochrome family protein
MKTIVISMMLAALAAGAALGADAKAGQAVFDKSCKSCHGADGTANPAIVKMMKIDIRDLKSPEVQAHSDTELKKIVTEGQGKMRPIPSVTGAWLDDVIAYLRSLRK